MEKFKWLLTKLMRFTVVMSIIVLGFGIAGTLMNPFLYWVGTWIWDFVWWVIWDFGWVWSVFLLILLYLYSDIYDTLYVKKKWRKSRK